MRAFLLLAVLPAAFAAHGDLGTHTASPTESGERPGHCSYTPGEDVAAYAAPLHTVSGGPGSSTSHSNKFVDPSARAAGRAWKPVG